jgi:hypothetical protein
MQLQHENTRWVRLITERKPIPARYVPFACSLEFPFERVIVVERDNYIIGLYELVGELSVGPSGLRVDLSEPLSQCDAQTSSEIARAQRVRFAFDSSRVLERLDARLKLRYDVFDVGRLAEGFDQETGRARIWLERVVEHKVE